MNNNVSECKIEIDGQEYTLFLNRTGIVNWEKMTKLEDKVGKYGELKKTIEGESEIEINDDTDPFTMFGESEDIDESISSMLDVYVKFYWVALYTHHKLTLNQTRELFDKAVEEYGVNQLAELANQMLEDANNNMFEKRKNLSALRPTKKN